MDALTGLLEGPRARNAFLLRAVLSPPFSVRVADRAPLSLVAMVRGESSLIPERGDPVRLRAGDVAIIRGPDPYVFADEPATAAQVIIHPGQRCTTPEGEDVFQTMDLGVRTWGNSPDGPVMALVGSYERHTEVSWRLLAALPPLLAQPMADGPLIPILEREIGKDGPAQEVVLDRLLDLLLITVLRAWFSRPEAEAPAWYRAFGDPVVGRALRLLHGAPQRPWTVAALAAEVGVSRATLARDFSELVGEPPMSYLTDWRLSLAADLLRETDATVEAVAARVGYGSGFALSAAFKRVRGVSPREHRRSRVLTTSPARSG